MESGSLSPVVTGAHSGDTVGNTVAAPGEAKSLSIESVLPAFRQLAASMGEVPVFAVEELPEGSSIAGQWWPVVDGDAPLAGTPPELNPKVVGEDSDEPEGQLLLQYADGWLCIIENFRGDLGDVAGEPVGEVMDAPAFLYEINGGWLVQWGYEGRWYGVFGRGVSRDVVVSSALMMSLVERY